MITCLELNWTATGKVVLPSPDLRFRGRVGQVILLIYVISSANLGQKICSFIGKIVIKFFGSVSSRVGRVTTDQFF